MKLPYEEAPGEAAFYGPKADFIVKDCIGGPWQLGTVQLITCCRSGLASNISGLTISRTGRS